MKTFLLAAAGMSLLAASAFSAQTDAPYKVLDTTQLMGSGENIDYVYADSDAPGGLMCRAAGIPSYSIWTATNMWARLRISAAGGDD